MQKLFCTTVNRSYVIFCDIHSAALIDIGWDAPAGQMYASTHDLAKLMQLIFRPEAAYDLKNGQVHHFENFHAAYG